MSEETPLLTPQDVAKALDVSPATLRRWADEFSDYLSKAASGEGRSHRRYSDEDLATLRVVKELMNTGLTYEQARQQLAQFVMAAEQATPASSPTYTVEHPAAGDEEDDDQELDLAEDDDLELNENLALVAANGNESAAVAFLTNTLTTLSDTQKSILNSQAANRELLGVLIQDNFNLKEENNRLRERILEVERSHAQTRQEEEWRREALRQELEAKLMSVQQLAANAMTAAQSVEMPEIKAVKSKAGCLGSLFGGGDTQIVTVPRRRGREGREARPTGPAKASVPQPPQQQPHYPKPTNLPE